MAFMFKTTFQLFIYILIQLFVYVSIWISGVCLCFNLNFNCLFMFQFEFQLFVYISIVNFSYRFLLHHYNQDLFKQYILAKYLKTWDGNDCLQLLCDHQQVENPRRQLFFDLNQWGNFLPINIGKYHTRDIKTTDLLTTGLLTTGLLDNSLKTSCPKDQLSSVQLSKRPGVHKTSCPKD